jgi:NAD-dependent deacetylase
MKDSITLDDRTHLLVLTGAGVSAESGLRTFRDGNGLWEDHRVEDVASPEGFERDPALVWRFYSQRRQGAKDCAPNAGHRTLAQVERHLGDRFLLATQNVDGLHSRAGNERVVEPHGTLFKTRCSCCAREPFFDERLYEDQLPQCDACAGAGRRAPLRPHIVWFGEMLDPACFKRIEAFMEGAENGRLVFLAVGTSGVVYPAAGLVDLARSYGATTWLPNAEPADNRSRFDHFVQGQSAQLLPALLLM